MFQRARSSLPVWFGDSSRTFPVSKPKEIVISLSNIHSVWYKGGVEYGIYGHSFLSRLQKLDISAKLEDPQKGRWRDPFFSGPKSQSHTHCLFVYESSDTNQNFSGVKYVDASSNFPHTGPH